MTENASLADVKVGIDFSLSYGLRMIQDAQYLEKDARYLSAIPLYVLAYEELGKGTYLISKYTRNIKVSESEWGRLTASPYAHYKKILVQYTNAISLLSRHTSEELENARKWEKLHGVYFPVPPRDFMLAKYKRSREIIKKLPIVKLACYYVDYDIGRWLSLSNYGQHLLKSVCAYLYHETMILHQTSKVELLKHSLNMRKIGKMKEAEARSIIEKYLANNDFIELNRLRTAVHQHSFVQTREHAFAVIEVIAKDYQHLVAQ